MSEAELRKGLYESAAYFVYLTDFKKVDEMEMVEYYDLSGKGFEGRQYNTIKRHDFEQIFKSVNLNHYDLIPTYKFGTISKERLDQAHFDLRLVHLYLSIYYDHSVLDAYRPDKIQLEKFNKGYSKARPGQSSHNYLPSLAVDSLPYPIQWKSLEEMSYYAGMFMMGSKTLMNLGVTENKIKWGGKWSYDRIKKNKILVDRPHFEILHWRNFKKMTMEENEWEFHNRLPRLYAFLMDSGILKLNGSTLKRV